MVQIGIGLINFCRLNCVHCGKSRKKSSLRRLSLGRRISPKLQQKKEVAQKMNEIHLFVEGVASVCGDAKIIAEKALAFFGEKDKRNVDFVLSLKTVRDLFLI